MTQEVGLIIICILPIRKLKHREVKLGYPAVGGGFLGKSGQNNSKSHSVTTEPDYFKGWLQH